MTGFWIILTFEEFDKHVFFFNQVNECFGSGPLTQGKGGGGFVV